MVFRLELSDFGAFYERTYDPAYRTALGIVRDPALAADVTQEAYVAAYRHRHRYRGDAPSAAWLHRIVVNQALPALRRRRATQAKIVSEVLAHKEVANHPRPLQPRAADAAERRTGAARRDPAPRGQCLSTRRRR